MPGQPNERSGRARLALCRKTDRYVGEMRDGKAQGRSTYVWANGERYEGDFVDDKKTSGKMTRRTATGTTASGVATLPTAKAKRGSTARSTKASGLVVASGARSSGRPGTCRATNAPRSRGCAGVSDNPVNSRGNAD